MRRRKSIYSPLGMRVYGVVHILDGLLLILLGGRFDGGNLTYNYALWGAKRVHRRRQEGWQ